MSHYAVVAPPLFSHLSALQALAQELVQRGHTVTFIQHIPSHPPHTLTEPASWGRCFQVSDSLRAAQRRVQEHSSGSLWALIRALSALTDTLCRELPTVLQYLAVDGLIVDQMEPAGGLVAQALGIPFVSVACALPVNREPYLPLPVMPFTYRGDKKSRWLYQRSESIHDWLMRPLSQVIRHHCRHFGLPMRSRLDECLSPLAQLAQCIPAIDFPRRALPDCFHYLGALRPATSATAMPEDAARHTPPMVYSSLGTLQGHRASLFCKIAAACRRVGVDVMITHCNCLTTTQVDSLYKSGATWVEGFIDQPAFIRRADVVITHGGLNTVLDAISASTPILAVPVAFDQPAVAARVVFNGLGRRVSRFAPIDTLAHHLEQLLSDHTYRLRMRHASQQLRQAGGVTQGATIVEQAIGHNRRVCAEMSE